MDESRVSSELSRELTLFHITMMGLGMMIGAGVFLGIGNSIHYAGPGGVILTFILNGLLAIFTAMSYAELSSAVPRAGGAYNFARIGFGKEVSFLAGWMEWFASSIAGSMYALTFAIYSVRYMEALGLFGGMNEYLDYVVKAVALMIAGIFLYINYRGASETGKVGAFFTLGQTLFLAFIGISGIFVAFKDPSRLNNFQPFMPLGWSRLLMTMGFTYVAFEGFEVIAQAGDEAIDPRRNLPKAMLYSVYVVTIIYASVAFATVVSVKAGQQSVGEIPWEWIGQFREKGFGEAVSRLMPYGNFLLTLAVIFASTSALNATIYSATRASFALGRDRMLPSLFSNISRKQKTPWVALLFTGLIIVSVATFLPTLDVASSASIMFLFLFFLVNICVIRIRIHMGDELSYGFLSPWFPLFPLLAIGSQAILAVWLAHMSRIAWIVAPAWIATGMLVYHFYSRARAVTTAEEIVVLEEEKIPSGDEYRVMVAVANPDNALSLVRNTYKLCGAKKARVELLHMVPVPDQVPLTDAEQYMTEGKEGIGEAMLYFTPLFPVSTTFRYCRNVARGIVNAVREKKSEMLIMGWHGRSRTFGFTLGSTIDPVIERAPCNVVVMKDCGNREFRRILVPLAGGPNGAFALEIAGILAEKNTGVIVAFTVTRRENGFDIERFVEEHVDRIPLPKERISVKKRNTPRVVDAILKEADAYDLIVIGATRESFINHFTRDSIPEIVARRFPKSLVMVNCPVGLRSWLRRIF
jgi:amino acid transporter/nucleotide-binding universal stress UspA family protein